jgi:hypothetical protein
MAMVYHGRRALRRSVRRGPRRHRDRRHGVTGEEAAPAQPRNGSSGVATGRQEPVKGDAP